MVCTRFSFLPCLLCTHPTSSSLISSSCVRSFLDHIVATMTLEYIAAIVTLYTIVLFDTIATFRTFVELFALCWSADVIARAVALRTPLKFQCRPMSTHFQYLFTHCTMNETDFSNSVQIFKYIADARNILRKLRIPEAY